MARRRIKDRPIPVTMEIAMFIHCRHCVETIPFGQSPQTWARLSIGWTPIGLQVWCNRHELNLLHVDFEGQQHPARQDGEATMQ